MPTHDRVEIVRFSGGELSGLVVEAPQDLAAQLPFMKLTLTAAGALLDVDEQCRLRGVRVLQRPGEQAAAPVPAAPPAPAPLTLEPPTLEPLTPEPLTREAASAPARRPAVSIAPVFLAARPAP